MDKQILDLKREAKNIAYRIQKRINEKGAYENAGQKELRIFGDKVRSTNLPYGIQCDILEFSEKLIDELKY